MGWFFIILETAMERMSTEQIRKLAYSYYQDRNYQMGNPNEDWNRARNEIIRAGYLDTFLALVCFVVFILCITFLPDTLTPFVVFWGFIFFIILVTIYTSIRPIVFERLFRFLHAIFISLLAAVPAFTFSFQYWPELNIVDVQNIRPYDLRSENIKGNRISYIPNTAVVKIKNSSSAVVRDVEIRYWLVMKSEKQEDQCTLTYSTSDEKFGFGPQEEKSFEFDFGPLKDKDLEKMETHFIHLIAQVRYRPLLFPFKEQKRWQVFYYSNAEGHWVTQRKNHWQQFATWYQELDRATSSSQLSLLVCKIQEKQIETQVPAKL